MRENKKCWACGKSLTGGEKLGLCDGCLNKYGNSYARRYNHIKGILMDYFSRVH